MCSKLRRYVRRLIKSLKMTEQSGISLLIAPVPVHCFSITFFKYVQKTCTKNKISWVLLAEFMLTSLTLFCIMYYTIKPALIAD